MGRKRIDENQRTLFTDRIEGEILLVSLSEEIA